MSNKYSKNKKIENSEIKKRRGPPNRINDLSYTEWMKFQKSFFWFQTDQLLVDQCISFFTKARWDDGEHSRSLIIGAPNFRPEEICEPRIVNCDNNAEELSSILRALKSKVKKAEYYDFILVDLRETITSRRQLLRFLEDYSCEFNDSIKQILKNEKYGCILANLEKNSASGFPLAWSISQSIRGDLRLRDEKIALVEKDKEIFYCIFFQSKEEPLTFKNFVPTSIKKAKCFPQLPTWILPKPPPRKKHEILHPAKFPETLIEKFIRSFTKEGDWVIDPMIGTGSAAIASLRTGRNAVGIDLIKEFVEIANQRINDNLMQASLPLYRQTHVQAEILQGDALELDKIQAIKSRQFDYAITSPPYWSVLRNRGSEYQRSRRLKDLRLSYSDHDRDLGNVEDYDNFLKLLVDVYEKLARFLKDRAYLTVIVKNVKRDHIVYPIAWDLTAKLCKRGGRYEYSGMTLWCQDDVGLKPFAVGTHWVSNVLHNYCLHFRKRPSLKGIKK